MPILDDEGNLFGVVNVVDALVVLLVLAVVAAGAALVLGGSGSSGDGPELATANVTLDLGAVPDYVAEEIEAGQTYSPGGNAEATITEVHVAPGSKGTNVVLGLALRGPVSEEAISYDGSPPRVGRKLTLQTDDYKVSGNVVEVGSGPNVTTTSVVVRETLDAETAANVDEGDRYVLAGHTVGTVEFVSAFATNHTDRRRLLLGLSLSTRRDGTRTTFGSDVVRLNGTLPFRTAEYEVVGTVRRVGATEPRGEAATRSVTLAIRGVSPTVADGVEVGATETVHGRTVARITAVDRRDATVVVTDQNGNLHERTHPVKEDLRVTAELSVRETEDGLTFKGRTIQRGSVVVLDLGDVTVRATVVST